MRDQADELRQLVLRGMRKSIPKGLAPPKLIVVAGGKGGVGATTLAVNLAIGLAREGRPTILVDADLAGGDAALLCRLEESYSVVDVLKGNLSVHEALQLGPAGVQVLPGAWGAGQVVECTPTAQERLLWELKGLGAFAEYVILDVGSSLNRVVKRFWQAADLLLLVTTHDEVSVMDAYAAVKVMLADGASKAVHTVVNRVEQDSAAEVHDRLARACRRFLGLRLQSAGHVSNDDRVVDAGAARKPLLIDYPDAMAARQIEAIASRLVLAATAGDEARLAAESAPPSLSA